MSVVFLILYEERVYPGEQTIINGNWKGGLLKYLCLQTVKNNRFQKKLITG